MEEETGLSRRYQREARKILRANAVLKEKKQGIPCMLWYWVDLEALHRIMETPYSTMNQWKRKQGTSHAQFSQDDITESTSESTAESSSDKYSSENSNFQFGEDHASRGLSRDKDMKIADSPKPSMGGLELNRIYYLLDTPGSEAYRAYEQHRGGSLSLEDLASEVCFALTGSRDQMEFYFDPVRRMVAELAIDDPAPDQPIRAE
jgi:hypothetical protein